MSPTGAPTRPGRLTRGLPLPDAREDPHHVESAQCADDEDDHQRGGIEFGLHRDRGEDRQKAEQSDADGPEDTKTPHAEGAGQIGLA